MYFEVSNDELIRVLTQAQYNEVRTIAHSRVKEGLEYVPSLRAYKVVSTDSLYFLQEEIDNVVEGDKIIGYVNDFLVSEAVDYEASTQAHKLGYLK